MEPNATRLGARRSERSERENLPRAIGSHLAPLDRIGTIKDVFDIYDSSRKIKDNELSAQLRACYNHEHHRNDDFR